MPTDEYRPSNMRKHGITLRASIPQQAEEYIATKNQRSNCNHTARPEERLLERDMGIHVQACKLLHRRASIDLFLGEAMLRKRILCFGDSLFTGKKGLRTWSTRNESSLRENQY